MATLARIRPPPLSNGQALVEAAEDDFAILGDVPAPFPMELLDEQGRVDESPFEENEQVNLDEGKRGSEEEKQLTLQSEVVTSLSCVQQSCLTMLNNLLLECTRDTGIHAEWQPIVPTRRHSMPPASPSISQEPMLPTSLAASLGTIISNLHLFERLDDGSHPGHLSQMRERVPVPVSQHPSVAESNLMTELQSGVDRIAGWMGERDAQLARALASLLAHVLQIGAIDPSSASKAIAHLSDDDGMDTEEVYEDLERQLRGLHMHPPGLEPPPFSSTSRSPTHSVELALLWTKVDQELETVLSLCRSRAESAPNPFASYQNAPPPEYEWHRDDDLDTLDSGLPGYDSDDEVMEKSKSKLNDEKLPLSNLAVATSSQGQGMSEKMKLDLDAVTLAIDRLYLAAPQLNNQRVQLRKGKLEEMERARLGHASTSSEFAIPTKVKSLREGKGKARDMKELDQIVNMIEKAASRKMVTQSVVVEGDMRKRFERAIQRDNDKREAFVEELLRHSTSRRMRSQDAIPSAGSSAILSGSIDPIEVHIKTRNPEALLTLPEFMQEQVPPEYRRNLDPNAVVSLPDVLNEPIPHSEQMGTLSTSTSSSSSAAPSSTRSSVTSTSLSTSISASSSGSSAVSKLTKKFTRRSRSLSAPPLAWLKARTSSGGGKGKAVVEPPPLPTRTSTLGVRYIAEHHENLQHVIAFLGVEGMLPGVDLEAEVLVNPSPSPRIGLAPGSKLVLKCGPSKSSPLNLPACVVPGKQEVRVQNGHYEVKIPTLGSSSDQSREDLRNSPLDASHLTGMTPVTFICASCSLPLVQAQPPSSSRTSISPRSSTSIPSLDYRDLPSEYWAELLDAWMCHHDQKLHDHVTAQHRRGFWPKQGEALVGGSYILFEETNVVSANLRDLGVVKHVEEEWSRVGCICGAVVGRNRRPPPLDAESKPIESLVYRFAKYAIRPVSPTAEPCRLPFSSFLLEDMMEHVQAHATYRFVILDEEDEKPRLLLWLFKPNMRLSYATTAQYTLPASGTIQAAKVLFKILGPEVPSSDLDSILDKYPGFPQAEHLLYPMYICHRLANLLKESNTAYPIGMRVMTGLLVGWLHRSGGDRL